MSPRGDIIKSHNVIASNMIAIDNDPDQRYPECRTRRRSDTAFGNYRPDAPNV